MTIAQIVYDNELHFGYSHDEIRQKVWSFMDWAGLVHKTDYKFLAPQNLGRDG